MSVRVAFSSLIAGLFFVCASPAMAQSDDAAQLRASGQAGEQADGYLGVVSPSTSGDIKARVDQVNIKRKAFYTDLAAKRGVTVQDVADATACTLLASKVAPGQFYRDASGAWQKRGAGSIAMPSYCPA